MYSKIMADEYLRKEENILKISDVRIRFVKKEDSKLKAVASITIDDCFVVHDIKIIEGADGPFIAMPSRKTNDGEFKDIAHPLRRSAPHCGRGLPGTGVTFTQSEKKRLLREPLFFVPQTPVLPGARLISF